MKFVYDKTCFLTRKQAEANCWLLANGLGGYMSTTAAFSVNRCDTGILIAAETAPNHRVTMVHRLSEQLEHDGKVYFLSTQTFADGRAPEEGYRYLHSFTWDGIPTWNYQVENIQTGNINIRRQCGIVHGANTTAITCEIANHSTSPCTLQITPSFLFAPKGEALPEPPVLSVERNTSGKNPERNIEENTIVSGKYRICLTTNGNLTEITPEKEYLYYEYDQRDGRSATGYAGRCCVISFTVPPGEVRTLELIFSAQTNHASFCSGTELVRECARRQQRLCEKSGFTNPIAQELARSADAFIVRRESTDGMSIIAGYPFFGDWGRDTMIALPGCTLSTGRYEMARSILRTFLAYEKEGLLPNLFPEGENQPLYNTADAALLWINCVWLYWQKTHDHDFIREAWPVMERIMKAYRTGTHFGICMDEDGLIRAGEGFDQVTWMDVRTGDILPTPRHGKPVEINAYWYNALCVMRELSPVVQECLSADRASDSEYETGSEYEVLAEQVKASFLKKFWWAEKNCLYDVLSGTKADRQIRCNQIWAVSMPFIMLPPEQARAVVETVYRELWTPQGLRTLSVYDSEFHPVYAGSQFERDMAYHQGTVWPFPVGAFYLAWLKVYGNAPETIAQIEHMLESMENILREGCTGQLPEVYDGLCPQISKGCFAQAWSVGELLRVYEQIEKAGE